jgi:hypothetical protein
MPRLSVVGRIRPVTKGRFRMAHRQGMLCGGEPGCASVIIRPKPARQVSQELSDVQRWIIRVSHLRSSHS